MQRRALTRSADGTKRSLFGLFRGSGVTQGHSPLLAGWLLCLADDARGFASVTENVCFSSELGTISIALRWTQGKIMAIVASGLVQQDEIRERVKKLEELFANDPEVARIVHRLDEDWSGDSSLFIDVVLIKRTPAAATVSRLSEQIANALLRVVRSEELGLHSYFNFVSAPENGR